MSEVRPRIASQNDKAIMAASDAAKYRKLSMLSSLSESPQSVDLDDHRFNQGISSEYSLVGPNGTQNRMSGELDNGNNKKEMQIKGQYRSCIDKRRIQREQMNSITAQSYFGGDK